MRISFVDPQKKTGTSPIRRRLSRENFNADLYARLCQISSWFCSS
jgi:hypothetical protein